jgi:putative peptidoglycan lipid II flippase
MVNKIFLKGKKLFTSPQESVLSAATIIMLMVVTSRILGLVRQRVLANFFAPDELSLFFAAFRLPDLVFEVLVFGTFSSAFIPVFTRSLKRGNKVAWHTASIVVNIGLLIFISFSIVLGTGANAIYGVFAPGFSGVEREIIVDLTRILFAAQGFFVISYVLTGVLESLRRFLVPALAPLFYNLGIILGTVFLTPSLGIVAPAIGVVIGAFAHFVIQLPLAMKLGFRFTLLIKATKDVKKIGRLALPRIVEVSFLQVSRVAELFFSSLISTAAYTYYTFGNSLRLLPVGLFGTSIAKAALPTFSRQATDLVEFRKTLFSALYDMTFFIIPAATVLIVLRVPIIRLVYGTDIFGWEATVQTGYVLTGFALGIVFQAASALLARSFYALHDTKLPVLVSINSILVILLADFIFITVLGFDVWGLALAFSIGSAIRAVILFYLINKRLENGYFYKALLPVVKSTIAALGSGVVMYFMLKIFDRSVWVKRLSFLRNIEGAHAIPFEKFVLDTRYTVNLIALTIMVSLVGILVYLGISILLRSEQVWTFLNLIKRVLIRGKVSPIPAKEQEPVAPTPRDTVSE